MLADHGLTISAGKMSGLWSGEPASIKLADLNVIYAVLGCGVEELLIPEPEKAERVDEPQDQSAAASATGGPAVTGLEQQPTGPTALAGRLGRSCRRWPFGCGWRRTRAISAQGGGVRLGHRVECWIR
ncbi:helix-turn-helix domain-containing protein [Actinomadura opuntiae]|uniref:helix-turn-helix domain-containing protein n=1 Tax=Actinomadura sp. OS1-43 TaxID=604315 RepID=UPI00255A9BE4|nr:helix-turn-helix transcriptional regulator [Actinomadura sp. OS1-43]MDL4818637.1 helix-turn-helix transcriptional regulator [Actinomadura sp. OS1-43]